MTKFLLVSVAVVGPQIQNGIERSYLIQKHWALYAAVVISYETSMLCFVINLFTSAMNLARVYIIKFNVSNENAIMEKEELTKFYPFSLIICYIQIFSFGNYTWIFLISVCNRFKHYLTIFLIVRDCYLRSHTDAHWNFSTEVDGPCFLSKKNIGEIDAQKYAIFHICPLTVIYVERFNN